MWKTEEKCVDKLIMIILINKSHFPKISINTAFYVQLFNIIDIMRSYKYRKNKKELYKLPSILLNLSVYNK